MKFKDEYTLERSGVMGETTFGMRATGKAFELLTAKLYSDRIGSVVRELSANAFDAHKAAGREGVPFDISVPHALDPTFIVKDYGTGLAPDDLKRLFGTVFESTKDQSDDYIGAFGLGSKSPFSLTDSYVVEGRWEGKIYSYLIFKNEQKLPSILETGVADTDEPNGITIKVPVSANHYHDFIRSLKAQLFLFEVKPNVLNARTWEWYDVQPNAQFDKTRLYSSSFKDTVREDAHHYVSMGKVMYPLDMTCLTESGIASKMKLINSVTITEFPIGSLDILPSREGLSYDEPTIKNLVDYFTSFLPLYESEVLESVKNAASTFEAWKVWSGLRTSEEYWRYYKDEVTGPSGETIQSVMKLHFNHTLDFVVDRMDYDATTAARDIDPAASTVYKKDIESRPAFEYVHARRSTSWQSTSITYNPRENVFYFSFGILNDVLKGKILLVLVDDPKNMQRKIKHLYDSGDLGRQDHVYLIHKKVNEKNESLDHSLLFDSIEKVVPGVKDKVVLLSGLTFPKVEKKPVEKVEKIDGVFVISFDDRTKTTNRRGVSTIADIIPGSPYFMTNRGSISSPIPFQSVSGLGLGYLMPSMKSEVVFYEITATAQHMVNRLQKVGLVSIATWLNNHFKTGTTTNIKQFLEKNEYLGEYGAGRTILKNLNTLASRFPDVELFKKGQELHLSSIEPETDLDAILVWIYQKNLWDNSFFAESGIRELVDGAREAVKDVEKYAEVFPMLEYTITDHWNVMEEYDEDDDDVLPGPHLPNQNYLKTLDYIKTLNSLKGN